MKWIPIGGNTLGYDTGAGVALRTSGVGNATCVFLPGHAIIDHEVVPCGPDADALARRGARIEELTAELAASKKIETMWMHRCGRVREELEALKAEKAAGGLSTADSSGGWLSKIVRTKS